MMKRQKVKLGDACNILNGYAFQSEQYKNDGYRVIRITNVQKGRIVDDEPKFYPPSETLNKFELKNGDILLSLTGNVGRVGMITNQLLPAYLNQRVGCLRLKNKAIYENYLFCFLNSDFFERLCVINAKGIAQKNLSTEWLKNIEIPLPPKEEQERIAKELDAVSDLLAKQKQLLTEQDTLIKSIFYDMFGNPVTNDKGWTIEKLEKLGTCKNGINFNKEEQGSRCYLLNVGDFQNYSVLDKITYFSEVVLKKMPDDDYFLKSGDIVFVRSNGNKNLVGRCVAIYPQDNKVLYSGFCIRFRIKQDDITTKYLLYYFKDDNIRKLLVGRGANIQNLNQKILQQLNIPVPPLPLQQKFADIVEQIEAQKQKIKSAISETETLFNALMAKYFDEE